MKAIFQTADVAEEWLDWLRNGHCKDVLNCGASGVELTALDGELLAFEVRYVFPDRAAFEAYEEQHAPRLRDEGLARFGTERGISYQRITGTVIYSS